MSTVPINRPRNTNPHIAEKLPQNIEAERSILGAVLLDNSALPPAMRLVHAGDFFLEQHRIIFRKMLLLTEAGTAIDLVTLEEALSAAGELAAAGGAAYLAAIGDGMPKVSNVAHYARIVRQKAQLRNLAYFAAKIQNNALETDADPDKLSNELEAFSRQTGTVHENPMIVVGCQELLTLDIPEPEFVMQPLLTAGGSMMIYSWAGLGKSFITTEIAAHLALGLPTVFDWPITRPFRTLYLYGEMHGGEIKKRWTQIATGHGMNVPEDHQLGFVSKEYQRIKRASRSAFDWRPSIFSPEDRRIVEDCIVANGYEVVILDNISTLWPASQEGSSDREAVLKNWFIHLNQHGFTVIVLTHAGKNGDFMGDSSQIHILDSVLRLRRPGNYEREEGLRVEVKIEKLRHECKDLRLLQEFEVSLQTDKESGAIWLTRPVRDAQLKSAFEMLADNMKPFEIEKSLGISLRTVYRLKKKYQENSDPKRWIGAD